SQEFAKRQPFQALCRQTPGLPGSLDARRLQYPREYSDATRTGQGLTKKNGLGLPSRLLQIWCPGPDSNRHSFRYHPLKMACLPVSPPGHHSLLEFGERIPALGFAVGCRLFSRGSLFSLRTCLRRFLNNRNTCLASHFGALLGKN